MTQKSILITGCSSGIGYATAQHLRQHGWRVIASCRKPEDVARLQREGFECLLLDQDDSHSIADCFAQITRLDAVFCNAGFGLPGAVEDIPRDGLRAIFETNVFGSWEVMHFALKRFRQQGHGRILINSSILGFAAMPFRGAYNSTKYALEGMADTLRQELRSSQIFISLIEPGPIQSRFRPNSVVQLQRFLHKEAVHDPDFFESQWQRLTKLTNANPFTLPAEACAEVCLNALESPRPHARYRVTKPTKLFWYLKRLFPTRLFDALCWRFGR